MSIVLGQKAVQAVIEVELKKLQTNTVYLDSFLDNFNDFSANFMDFINEAATLGISVENFIEPKAEIKTWILAQNFNVKLGYPREHERLPEINIVLGQDGEADGFLGGLGEEFRDDSDPDKDSYQAGWATHKQKTINVHITDNNPNSVEIMYQVLDYILVIKRLTLEQLGLKMAHYDAGDIRPNPEMLQAGQFIFERVISINCETISTYKTAFWDVSPMPNDAAMTSEDKDEDDLENIDLGETI